MLIAIPAGPRLNLEGGRVSPRRRLDMMQAIAMLYDVTRPTQTRDVKIVKAIFDPIVMREMRQVQTSLKMTALTGMSHPGRTCSS